MNRRRIRPSDPSMKKPRKSRSWVVHWFTRKTGRSEQQGVWVFDTRKEADLQIAAVKATGRLEVVGPLRAVKLSWVEK